MRLGESQLGGSRAAACAAALVVALGASACTDAGVLPIPPPPAALSDALLRVQGRFCTDPPESVVFPLKVLFLVDQSASLQCTDAQNRRFQALGELVGELRQNPHASFGFVGFSSWSRELPFTRDRAAIDQLLDPSGGLGPATDYQGALATALRLLETDMIDVGAALRTRTKYVIVFVSDGVAEPRCNAGCEDDESACSDGRDNDGDGLVDGDDPDCVGVSDYATHPDSLYGVCNTDREVGDDVYVDYEGICPAYNQPQQILQRVFELRALADLYNVGALTLHTVLLFAPQADVEAVCPGASAAFGYNGGQARALLQQMAQAGGGSFRDVNIASSGRFFDFDFVSLESRAWLTDLVATNMNARRAVAGFDLRGLDVLPDSDGDGVPDEVERAFSTSVTSRESDGGDNYGDLLELRERDAGFDARDAALPAAPCADAGDLDGDGLTNCEEAWLGTGIRDPDSDNDGVIDWLEVVAGTDPLVDDGARDLDFDGVSNRDELRAGTNPLVADAAVYRDERVLYGLTDLGDVAVDDGTGKTTVRHCYDVDVSRVPLAPTELGADRGRNRVLIYAHERPLALAGTESRVSVVCAEVRYEGPTAKVPADGRVDWSEAAWARDREELIARRDALVACRPGGHARGDVRRSDLDDLVRSCLDDKVALGGRLVRGAELRALLAAALDNRLRPRWAATPSALWKPIESFDADRDCVRPDEPALVFALLERLRACLPCPEPPAHTAVTP